MKNVLGAGMAVVLVTVLVVGAALALGGGLGTRSELGSNSVMSRAQGVMPEVVGTAEMPRLLMPVVEVVAFRTVAMTGSGLNVN